MICKTAELTGPALDWAFGSVEGQLLEIYPKRVECYVPSATRYMKYSPSTDWWAVNIAIDRHKICIEYFPTTGMWTAYIKLSISPDTEPVKYWMMEGETPLLAVTRCRINQVLGQHVEVPDMLC